MVELITVYICTGTFETDCYKRSIILCTEHVINETVLERVDQKGTVLTRV